MEEPLSEEQLFLPLTRIFGQKITKFPSMMPVSVDRKNVGLLSHGYCASSKADGDTVYAFVSKNKLVLMRRNKQTQSFGLSHSFEHDYIFEGEYLVQRNRFLIYDVIVFQHEPRFRLNYLLRIELANYFINELCPKEELHRYRGTIILTDTVKPLPSDYPHGVTWKTTNISLQVKPPYAINDAAELWRERHMLPYSSDGIIFTRLCCGYRPFSEDVECVLKWKEDVTVDFVVKMASSKNENTLHLPQEFAYPANCSQANATLFASYNADVVPVSRCVLSKEQIPIASQQVCEFSWNRELCIWIFSRVRFDKLLPNQLSTVISCLNSIKDSILISEITELAS